MTKGIPAGFHTVSPHMVLSDASAAIEFYKKAFGAVEHCRLEMPGTGKLMHAQIQIGDSQVMLMDEMDGPGCSAKSPLQFKGSPIALHLYVEDVDAAIQKAVDAGAEITMPAEDMFWGDRYGRVKDPFGYDWSIATQVRQLSPEEMKKGMMEACAAHQAQPVA